MQECVPQSYPDMLNFQMTPGASSYLLQLGGLNCHEAFAGATAAQ